MSVETNAKFITEFNEAYPRKGDLIKEGDDHMRLIKSVLKNTLPEFNRAVTISSDKLNKIDKLLDVTDDTFTINGNITVGAKKAVNLGNNVVSGVSDPVEDTDAANKQYVKLGGVAAAWPVDSIFMTMDTRDPKDIFGFGEWEKFASGRVLIGTGSDKDTNNEAKLIALGGKGGTYNETLTEKQIPPHKHPVSDLKVNIEAAGEHTHGMKGTYGPNERGKADTPVTRWEGRTETYPSGLHTHKATVSGDVGSSGGGEKHNNMMPYIGVNMWRRLK